MSLVETLEISETAMILAAGYGHRMLPLTKNQPKPLLNIRGKTFLDHILDHLEVEKITKTIINTFYLKEQIEEHFASHPRDMTLVFSREEILLDTGGGVKRALPEFGYKPFWLINSDIFWQKQEKTCFDAMKNAWDFSKMDALLLLIPPSHAWGYGVENGQFLKAEDGKLSWKDSQSTPLQGQEGFYFGGIQLIHPDAYKGIPDMIFSNRLVWEHLMKRHRLYGLVWYQDWFHLGTLKNYQTFQQDIEPTLMET